MSGKKTTSEQTQNQSYSNQNQYGQITPDDTADTKAFRDWKPQIDPTIGYRAGEQKNKLRSSLISPTGGYYSANTRDAIQRSGERQIDSDAAQQYRTGQYDQNQQRSGQLGTLAALTAPRILQTGSSGSGTGSSSGTTKESGDILGQLISGGSQVGSAALL